MVFISNVAKDELYSGMVAVIANIDVSELLFAIPYQASEFPVGKTWER